MNCPKCGNPVYGQSCQGCALLRKKFKEDLFTSCVENGILPDSFEPSNDNTNVVNALQDPFVVNQDLGENSSQSPPQINHHCCYGCVPIIPDPKPFNNQTIKELPLTVPSFDPTCYSEDGNSLTYDSTSNIVHDSFNIFNPPSQPPLYSFEFCENDARYGHYCTPQEPDNSLSMGDEHLDTISATKSDDFIKSSVENLVPNLIESEGEHECDVPALEVFTTFSNILFDFDYDFFSSDDQSFSNEDILKEIYSNPLFDEEIIYMKIDLHHFNAESDPIYSLLNHDSSIISSSSKIDSLFDEFADKLTLLKSIPSRINETDCDPDNETRFIKRLLYNNSSPRPPKEFIFENSNAAFESFSPSLIVVEDSDSLMEEVDLSFTPDDPMLPGIEEDDYDSERDIHILEELLSHNSLSLSENETFHFDIPSSSRPPAKPPNGNSGILNIKVMGDISEHKKPAFPLLFVLWFCISSIPGKLKTHAEGFCPPSFHFLSFIRESYDPMPSGIKEDDYDSKRDILILEELLSHNSLSLPKNKSFHFDIPSSSRPPTKPSNGNSGILNVKVMGYISEHKVSMPKLMSTQSTLVPNQEKSPKLLPHLGHEAFQLSVECQMIIYGKNTPILDVSFFHFYPP
nr:hypothetical protein [Tanacetum cinerariifolium]